MVLGVHEVEQELLGELLQGVGIGGPNMLEGFDDSFAHLRRVVCACLRSFTSAFCMLVRLITSAAERHPQLPAGGQHQPSFSQRQALPFKAVAAPVEARPKDIALVVAHLLEQLPNGL